MKKYPEQQKHLKGSSNLLLFFLESSLNLRNNLNLCQRYVKAIQS